MNPALPPVELIALAAERLGNLVEDVTFLGGASVALLVTDPAARPARATNDVDVVIELASRQDFYALEKTLRRKGFQNATEGPICRFTHGLTVLDIMPTDPSILGFANRWYRWAIRTAQPFELPNGRSINLITPGCLLATKLDAFDSDEREGGRDMFLSRDFEDIVAVVDGRPTIAADLLATEVEIRAYVRERLARQAKQPYWLEGIEAHVESGRTEIVARRFATMIEGVV